MPAGETSNLAACESRINDLWLPATKVMLAVSL